VPTDWFPGTAGTAAQENASRGSWVNGCFPGVLESKLGCQEGDAWKLRTSCPPGRKIMADFRRFSLYHAQDVPAGAPVRPSSPTSCGQKPNTILYEGVSEFEAPEDARAAGSREPASYILCLGPRNNTT